MLAHGDSSSQRATANRDLLAGSGGTVGRTADVHAAIEVHFPWSDSRHLARDFAAQARPKIDRIR